MNMYTINKKGEIFINLHILSSMLNIKLKLLYKHILITNADEQNVLYYELNERKQIHEKSFVKVLYEYSSTNINAIDYLYIISLQGIKQFLLNMIINSLEYDNSQLKKTILEKDDQIDKIIHLTDFNENI